MTFVVALATLALALFQAPAPAQAPPPQSLPAATAAGPSASAPPRPTVPVALKDPAHAEEFLHIFHLEQDLDKSTEAYRKSAQDKINSDLAKMQGYFAILADEMKELRRREGWAEDVQFNPQTEKFERPLPGPGKPAESATPAKPTAAAPEKKP